MNKNSLLAIIMVLAIAIIAFGILKQKKEKPLFRMSPDSIEINVPNNLQIPKIEIPPDIKIEINDNIIKNAKNYVEALKLAKDNNRDVFIYFGATWCGNCTVMKKTLDDKEVDQKLHKEYIVYYVDVDKDRETARKYNITGVPACFIVSSEGKMIEKIVGSRNKKDFLNWLKPENVTIINLW